jgi:hypothetical protein
MHQLKFMKSQDIYPFCGIDFLKQLALDPNVQLTSYDIVQSLILTLQYVLYHNALSSRLELGCAWWQKMMVMDIIMTREHFASQMTHLPLPSSLLGCEATVVKIVVANLQKVLTAQLPKLLEAFNTSVTQRSIRHDRDAHVSSWTLPKLLGKRRFQHESQVPTLASSSSKQIPDQHCSFNTTRMCSNSNSESGGNAEEYSTQAMTSLLRDKLRNHSGPTLMPLPPIIPTSNDLRMSYQRFYQGMLEVTTSHQVKKAWQDFISARTGSEAQLAELMNTILKVVADKLSFDTSVKVMSSSSLTMAKTDTS